MRPYIGDGYDQEFYIAGTAMNPPIKFSGRRMACHEALLFATSVLRDGATAEDHEKCWDAIAEKIKGWSYKDEDDGGKWKPIDDHEGKPLPINGKSLSNLMYLAALSIRNIVLGIQAPDADPEKANAVPPGTPSDDGKNSQAGCGSS